MLNFYSPPLQAGVPELDLFTRGRGEVSLSQEPVGLHGVRGGAWAGGGGDAGGTAVVAECGRGRAGLGTAATRNAEDTLTNGSNLPDGAAIISYINGRGFITDPNDSVQPSELDGTFSTVGLLKRLGAGSYTTVPDNSANWDQAFGWGNHATQGYLKTYNPNDSVDASELEVLFGPLGAGLMIHSASGQFNVTPDNHANWDTAYTDRMKWDGAGHRAERGHRQDKPATGHVLLGNRTQPWDGDGGETPKWNDTAGGLGNSIIQDYSTYAVVRGSFTVENALEGIISNESLLNNFISGEGWTENNLILYSAKNRLALAHKK
jgi:hypothetical protein